MLDSFVSIPQKQECMQQVGTQPRGQKWCRGNLMCPLAKPFSVLQRKTRDLQAFLPIRSTRKFFSQSDFSETLDRIICATWVGVHVLGVMTPQQPVSGALRCRETIQQYHQRSLVVHWVNSSMRSQCGHLARSLWGIAIVMIETRVPQDKDQKGWLQLHDLTCCFCMPTGQNIKKPEVRNCLTSRCSSHADAILVSPAFMISHLGHCILNFSNLSSQSLDFTKSWSARLRSPWYQQCSFGKDKHKVYCA